MSFDLELSDIRYICGEVIYNKAMDMYLRNKVRSVEVTENSHVTFAASAVVQSAYDVNNYKISFIINNKNFKIYPSCTCDEYYRKGFCKHIGAVLIKINKEGTGGKKATLLSDKDELMEVYKNSSQRELSETTRKTVEFDTTLIIEESGFSSKTYKYYLEFKIGDSRMYVVKNIRDLIECIFKSGGTIRYGKELEYNNAFYEFKDIDKKVLNLLRDLYEFNLQVMDTLYTNKSVFFSGKRAVLTEGFFKRFFKLMEGNDVNFIFKGEDYGSVTLKNGCLPISFYMFADDEKLNLDVNGKMPVAISQKAGLYFIDNTLYLLPEDQTEDFIHIYNTFHGKDKRTISFNKSEAGDVANYIMPKLKKFTPLIIKDDVVSDLMEEKPLSVRFYLDYNSDKNEINCNIRYVYGDQELDGNGQCSFLRDFKGEGQIVKQVRDAGFKGEGLNLYMDEDENIAEFLTYGIECLRDAGEVYYSDAFKNVKIINHSSFSAGIRLNDVDLLEFDFTIDGFSDADIKNTLDAIKKKKKYYRLKSGTLVSLHGDEVRDLGAFMDSFDISAANLASGKAVIPKYASLYLDEKIHHGGLGFVSSNTRFNNLMANIKNVNKNDYEVPELQKKILRPYQVTGFKWFKTLGDCGFGGILGDEMGLGKTLQSITYISSQLNEGKLKDKALIVCPTSLVYNWEAEFKKFAPDITVAIVSGSKKERENIFSGFESYDVIITSYALLKRDMELYEEHNFDLCIIDEAQYIKNPGSLNAASVKTIKAKKRFAMTGTPIENSLTELWSIFDFIMPGYLKSHGRFVKDYENAIIKNKDENAVNELLKLIKPFILRRFKKDVVLELPPKIEHKVLVDMTKEQKKLYYAYVEEYRNEMKSEIREKGINKSRIKILSLITRLRQLCCDPGSFIENYNGDSGKYLALYDILEEALENNHKVLLFSQFTTILGTIREKLIKKGIKYMYLDGSVPSKDRMNLVNEFNEGDPTVFLISLKAGGTGLNLTVADMVIHFDPWWNPAVEDQAVDRAHRIGQKNTVEVIKLIARGTIEEKINKIQEAKKAMVDQIIDGEEHDTISLSSMDEKDIEDLFTI